MEVFIGLIGVIVGAIATTAGTALWHKHTSKIDLYKRILAFYAARIESLRTIESNLVDDHPGPPLETSRAPLRAELLLVAPQAVLDGEQQLFECLWSRETDRWIKLRHFRETGSQTQSLFGAGPHESSGISMARLRHAHKLFDETYESLVRLLRDEMSFWKTFEYVLSEKPPVQLPSMFAVHNPTMQIQERVNADPDSIEMIWRGRIADRMAAHREFPFEIFAFSEELSASSGSKDLAVEYNPPTPGPKIDGNQLVPGALGYEILFLYSPERLNEHKQNIREYFRKSPKGRITFKKRNVTGSRNWDDLLAASSDEISKIDAFLEQEAQNQWASGDQQKSAQEKQWTGILRRAGKEIPIEPKDYSRKREP